DPVSTARAESGRRRASAKAPARILRRDIVVFSSGFRVRSESQRRAEQPRRGVVRAEERSFAGEALLPRALLEGEVHEGEVGLDGALGAVGDGVAVAGGVGEERVDALLRLRGLVVDVAEAPLARRAGVPADAQTVVIDILPLLLDGRVGERV